MMELRALLKLHGQEHLLEGVGSLPEVDCQRFESELRSLDFEALNALFAKRNESAVALPSRDRIHPTPVEPFGHVPAEIVERGEVALRNGEVAVLLVAGGQGTRLGFDHPKGMYPVGPISGATLFQIHAEKVLALTRRYGQPVPLLVMTSPATHAETVAFFEENSAFGLAAEQVHFFTQGTMPALDAATGKVLLEAPGQLFLSPNGHGGTLTALAESGLLERLKSQGVKQIFYFQVDNPLVKIAEPGFLGMHIERDCEASSKVVFKEEAGEKVGILALVDGKCGIVEYSDMPAAMSEERSHDGTLAFRAGNPAIHIFSVPFLERVTSGKERLEYHIARKKVAHVGDPEPTGINALKFELFIFDALPLAKRWLVLQTLREEEFAPLKNASGADSLATLQAAMLAQSQRWLKIAGLTGLENCEVEISPLFAMDPSELKMKTITPGKRVYLN